MMQNILPPPALQGDERAQLTQVYRYLFRLSEQLNMGLGALEQRTATGSRSSGAAAGADTDSEKLLAEADRQYQDLKSLIIKTADNVRAEMDQIVTRLNSKYVAKSEWGTYKESVSREIVDTAKHTIENFQYGEEVLDIPEMAAMFDEYRIETSGYIKRGIIGFDSSNFPIIGIAIGQGLKYKKVTSGGKVYEVFDNSQNMATYAADKLSFWIDGAEVAYMSNSELVVTRIIVSDSIQLGSWDIAVNSDDGLTVQKRIGNALDLSGNNTITVTADQINAVADDIDLSGNTSIKLSAGQINAVANDINLSGNKSITLIAGKVESLGKTATEAAEKADAAIEKSDATLEAVNDAAIYTGADEPASPTAGKIWLDTGSTPNLFRRWNGSAWDTISDADDINNLANQLALQQAEIKNQIKSLAMALSVETDGVHFFRPKYRDQTEVCIDEDSVDVLVGGRVSSSFLANGLIVGDYMLWYPEAKGGMAFNLVE